MTICKQRPNRCTSAGRVTANLLLSFLALSTTSVTARFQQSGVLHGGHDFDQLPIIAPIVLDPANEAFYEKPEQFKLRHLFHHGTNLYPSLHRRKDVLDSDAQLYSISDDGTPQALPPLMIRSQSTRIYRLADRRPSTVDPIIAAARENGEMWTLSPSAWTMDDIPGPNMSDKATVLTLAEMAASAYVEDSSATHWENINAGFNSTTDFGWEDDGLRGHVWANENNSTVVISLKGTTVAVFDGDGTTTPDKENDNLFFSCCCGQQSQLNSRKVCDCASSTYSCNNTCVTQALRKENRYYMAARELYSNVTALYPDSNVWVSGHSLGGSVSSLLGMTYGLPTITFEAPPENLAAKRLGLPMPPGVDPRAPHKREYTGAYHVGHTADPIFLGICNGVTSPCSWGGYAMESACHTSVECVYDVVADFGWRVATNSHSIRNVIENVIKKYDHAPKCEATPECQDCPLWRFYESNSSLPITTSSSSSTKTRTRTETCKTPGWWGCLDESTTAGTATSSSSRITTTTSTCETPGWFGCKDETTSSSKTESPTATVTKTSSTPTCTSPGFFGGCNDPTTKVPSKPTASIPCETPGFWGCKDKATPEPTSHPITSPPIMPTPTAAPAPTKHTCTSREWFGLICVDPSPTTPTQPSPTNKHPPEPSCVKRGWFGNCKKWENVEHDEIEEL